MNIRGASISWAISCCSRFSLIAALIAAPAQAQGPQLFKGFYSGQSQKSVLEQPGVKACNSDNSQFCGPLFDFAGRKVMPVYHVKNQRLYRVRLMSESGPTDAQWQTVLSEQGFRLLSFHVEAQAEEAYFDLIKEFQDADSDTDRVLSRLERFLTEHPTNREAGSVLTLVEMPPSQMSKFSSAVQLLAGLEDDIRVAKIVRHRDKAGFLISVEFTVPAHMRMMDKQAARLESDF